MTNIQFKRSIQYQKYVREIKKLVITAFLIFIIFLILDLILLFNFKSYEVLLVVIYVNTLAFVTEIILITAAIKEHLKVKKVASKVEKIEIFEYKLRKPLIERNFTVKYDVFFEYKGKNREKQTHWIYYKDKLDESFCKFAYLEDSDEILVLNESYKFKSKSK